jgi:hypothetical protein
MTYQAVPTVNPGDSWSASQHNSYIRDNFAALWPYTTVGDMNYLSGAGVISRLGIGTAYQLMRSTGSAPAWDSLANLLANAAMVSSQAAEDLFVGASATSIKRLAKGSNWNLLRVNGSGLLEWGTLQTLIAQQALVSGQAAGDLFYALSGSAIASLAKPANTSILKHNGTVPSYVSMSSLPLGVLRSNSSGTDVELAPIGKKCVAYSSVDKNVPGGAITAMALNSEVVDDGNWHDTVTNNSRITVDADGWYVCSAQARISHSGTDPYCRIYIRLNGTTTYLARGGSWGFGGYPVELNITSKPYQLAAGDYIQMCLESVATDRTMDNGVANNWLSVMRVQ